MHLKDSTKAHFFDYTPETLALWCREHGMAEFRAKQIMQWVYEQGVVSPDKMLNLSQKDRACLQEHLCFVDGQILKHMLASDGTQKLLIDWSSPAGSSDKAITDSTQHEALPVYASCLGDSRSQTETVMIPSESKQSGKSRKTACVSSQAGCPVGCKFCASGLTGLDGNLSAGRIIQQIWMLGKLPEVERVSHVVFMGMGEPLSNFDNLKGAIIGITSPWGLGISARRVTVSTVGVPSQMKRLAELELPLTLAISLHAPDDELRKQIIPWAKFNTIEKIVEAGSYYFEQTGREVTLEYILLAGVNDSVSQAKQLAEVAHSLRSNVNLIRYNEVDGLPFNRPTDEAVHAFQQTLENNRVNVHIRASRGRDIKAACGQLRHEGKKAEAENS